MNENPKRFVIALDNVWDHHWLQGYEERVATWRGALASLKKESSVLIAANSGLRVGEQRQLRWSDVQIEKTYYHLNDEIRLTNAVADYRRREDGTIEVL